MLLIEDLKELWNVMSLKSEEIQKYFIENKNYDEAEWLNNWITENRLTSLITYIETKLPDIDENGKAKLHKRIKRYINYFDILDKDDDRKYEYMFNYLTEIPCQIVHYLENYNNKEVR